MAVAGSDCVAVLANLDRYYRVLNDGVLPRNVTAKFIHPEGNGIYALDQTGGGPNLKATRLYLCLKSGTVWLLTIGDKGSQASDIQLCRKLKAAV